MCFLKANINIDSGETSCGPGLQLPQQAGFPTVPALCFYPLRQLPHNNFSVRLVCIIPFSLTRKSEQHSVRSCFWSDSVWYLRYAGIKWVCKNTVQIWFLGWNVCINIPDIRKCLLLLYGNDTNLTRWNIIVLQIFEFWPDPLMMRMLFRICFIAALLVCCELPTACIYIHIYAACLDYLCTVTISSWPHKYRGTHTKWLHITMNYNHGGGLLLGWLCVEWDIQSMIECLMQHYIIASIYNA